MKLKKSLVLMLVMAFMASLFSGFSLKKAEDQIEIEILSGNPIKIFDAVKDDFMKKYPNIKVTPTVLGGSAYDQKLAAMDSAGKLPDIFITYNIGENAVKSWYESGKIADVSNFKVVKQAPKGFTKAVTYSDGKTYVVPLSYNPFGIVYNKALFKKAGITKVPRTLNEMKIVCQKLKAKGITPFGVGGKDYWTLGNTLWRPGMDAVYPTSWSAKMYEGKASFKDYGKQLFPFIDLLKANCQPKPLNTDYTTQATLFASGKVAMLCMGTWVIDNIRQLKMVNEKDCGSFPITWSNDKSKNKMFVNQGDYFMVSSQANLDAVDKFFDFLVNSPEGKKAIAENTQDLSVFGIKGKNNPMLNEAESYIKSGDYVFNFQDNNLSPAFFTVFGPSVQEYFSGKSTADQVLATMDKKFKEFNPKK